MLTEGKKLHQENEVRFPRCNNLKWCGFKIEGNRCFYAGDCNFKEVTVSLREGEQKR